MADENSDIVERLRAGPSWTGESGWPLCKAAADEIEMLRVAAETVCSIFEKDVSQGFKTRDKEFAVAILRKALGAAQNANPPRHPPAEWRWMTGAGMKETR